ncbi:unnamed protein product [Diamesa tonsa]
MNFSQCGKINSGSPKCNKFCSIDICSGRNLSHPYSISNLSTPTFSNRSYPQVLNNISYPEQKRNFIESMEKGQPHIYGWNSCERINPSSTPQSFMNDCCPPADCCDEFMMNNQCLMPEDSCSPSCMQCSTGCSPCLPNYEPGCYPCSKLRASTFNPARYSGDPICIPKCPICEPICNRLGFESMSSPCQSPFEEICNPCELPCCRTETCCETQCCECSDEPKAKKSSLKCCDPCADFCDPCKHQLPHKKVVILSNCCDMVSKVKANKRKIAG